MFNLGAHIDKLDAFLNITQVIPPPPITAAVLQH